MTIGHTLQGERSNFSKESIEPTTCVDDHASRTRMQRTTTTEKSDNYKKEFERINTKEVEDFVPNTSDDLKVTRLCHHHSDVFKIESLYLLRE